MPTTSVEDEQPSTVVFEVGVERERGKNCRCY
jgi:hypothetical protein